MAVTHANGRQVPEFTYVGGDELRRAARDAGASASKIARHMSMAERTWWRWVKNEQVPTPLLPALQQVLPTLNVPGLPEPLAERLARLEGDVTELAGLVRELGEEVAALRRAAGGSRPGGHAASGPR